LPKIAAMPCKTKFAAALVHWQLFCKIVRQNLGELKDAKQTVHRPQANFVLRTGCLRSHLITTNILQMKNKIQELISELEARSKSHEEIINNCVMYDTERVYTVMKSECDFVIQKLMLLLNDESKQPQPPISQTPMLGEVPPVVNGGTKEISKAVEGATPVVRQNEQTKEVCPKCGSSGLRYYGVETFCPVCKESW